jgi:rhodanese-related sulfurtransferase
VVVSLGAVTAQMGSFTTVDHQQAQQLIDAGITVIDVRTPREYAELGHIPGAWLVPVDLIASAPAILDDGTHSVLVYCEHGVRSRAAAGVLSAAGVGEVLNLAGGLEPWRGAREFGPGVVRGPSAWLLDNADLLQRGGRVLDVACGRGRHALLLAGAGFEVTAIDRNAEAIARLRAMADRLGFPITTQVIDLEADPPIDLGSHEYDTVLGFRYLHRPLMPALKEAVKPGGRIFYETFTRRQAERGHPRNPAFLLDEDELPRLMAPFEILRSREGEIEGQFIASIVAERPK